MGMWEARMFPLLIWTGLLVSTAVGIYDLKKCYCKNDINAQLEAELKTITNKPFLEKFQYYGVLPLSQTLFQACTCEDVTRTKARIVFDDEEVYQKAQTNNGKDQIKSKISESLKELAQNRSLDGKLAKLTVIFLSDDSSTNETTFEVEFLMKTRDEDMNTQTDAAFQPETDNSGRKFLPNVGRVKDPGYQSRVLKCEENPAEPERYVERTWNDQSKLPGTKASYKCKDGFVTGKNIGAQVSTCGHDFNWTKTYIDCVVGCSGKPPDKVFMIRRWNKVHRHVGTKIDYDCIQDYWPILRVKHSSTCLRNKLWSNLPPDFACERINCLRDEIPQTPAFGRVQWNNKTEIRTTITYYCKEGYKATVKGNTTINCTVNGKWSPLLEGFQCESTISLFKSGLLDYYDEYDNTVYAKKTNTKNWWLIVTVPSAAGIAVFILVCLCVTRTDRFLFMLCGCCTDKKH